MNTTMPSTFQKEAIAQNPVTPSSSRLQKPKRIDIHWEERRLAAKAKSKDFQKFLDRWKFRFDRNDKISLMFFFYTNSFCCIIILKTVNFSKDAHVSL